MSSHMNRTPHEFSNMTCFDSLESFIRATNPANKICLLLDITSILLSPSFRGCQRRRSESQCVYPSSIQCSGSICCSGLSAANRRDTNVDSMWRNRIALSRQLLFSACGSSSRGEHSVGGIVRGCTSRSCTGRCVFTGRLQWTVRRRD